MHHNENPRRFTLSHLYTKNLNKGITPMITETIEKPTLTATDKLLDIAEVMGMVRISRTQIFNLIKVGRFPSSVSILDGDDRRIRKSFWRLSDVQSWITDLQLKPKTQKK
jgi:predicted DNA-binding transcriptional regulator AlpA